MQTLLIKTINLTYKIKNKLKNTVLLNNINLEINKGESICILGKNGAGKTTLMELLFGFREKHEGKIIFSKDFQKEKVAFVLQDLPFIFSNVQEIIKFHLKLFNKTKKDLNLILKQLDFLEIYSEKQVIHLSEGQKQKLKFLIALLSDPTFLVLDELTTSLDYVSKKNIINFLINFQKNKDVTLIIISHNIKEISLLSNKIYVLENKSVFEKNFLFNNFEEKMIFLKKIISNQNKYQKSEIKEFY